MNLTNKQLELMRVICSQPVVDLDEIVDAVRYETTKASLQFSIRALVKHGLIEKKGIVKRRGRQRQTIAATSTGNSMFGKTNTATKSYVTSVEDDELENL